MLIVVAVNYVAISEALGLSASVLAAGVAADNVICVVYFMVLFALASKIPAETAPPTTAGTIFLKHYSNSNTRSSFFPFLCALRQNFMG